MKALLLKIVWPAVFLFVFGCPQWTGAQQPVKLDRVEVVIDFKEEGYYRSIPCIALAADLLFITDNYFHRVLEYRLRGTTLEFIRAIGRAGQGPGDLMRPTDISVSKETLAVKDEAGISLFDTGGTFKGKLPLLAPVGAILLGGKEIYAIVHDMKNPNLIQVYSLQGEALRSFQRKTLLYPVRYDISKGFSPANLERTVFEGLLRSDGQSVFFLSKRFGSVLRYSTSGERTGRWELAEMLGGNEKAKAAWNRKMFLEAGFDLEKNNRLIPEYYLFEDAQIVAGRLYLLLGYYDLPGKKMKPAIEFAEIDLETGTVARIFTADAQVKWESAASFVFTGDKENPVFLARVRPPGEDEKLCIFKPERNNR